MAGFSLARAEERYGRPEDLLRKFSDTILNLGPACIIERRPSVTP